MSTSSHPVETCDRCHHEVGEPALTCEWDGRDGAVYVCIDRGACDEAIEADTAPDAVVADAHSERVAVFQMVAGVSA